jgi:hypothetical protein
MNEPVQQLKYETIPVETLARLRRVEVRMNQFMRWSGFNPTLRDVEIADGNVTVFNGEVVCSNPNITLGHILRIGQEQHLKGYTTVRIGDRVIADFLFI